MNKTGNFCGKVGYTTDQTMMKKLRRRNFKSQEKKEEEENYERNREFGT